MKDLLYIRELDWAAGLFEGEGSVSAYSNGRPALQLSMTDEDPVLRFFAAVKVGRVYGPYDNGPGRKPYWKWEAVGHERAQAVVAKLWFGLGVRRRARAAAVLTLAPAEGPRRAAI